ncbi:related to oxidoreductase CipA-like [Phialocephala subalpina]|uniref:Related to oxidoreductase CipA-like n=1 Tax=Phialocephala subalpina TaxID=576137 RepID=A0A1L7XS28_9HELO|nr:related to oxidoreductase CipA-like [Phialocephala subalpina]
MATSNHITKVAIVGAGGNSGKFMTEALLKTGKHTVTAITRADSQSKLPEGVISKSVDYDKPEAIVEAPRGQDALVITLAGGVPKDTDIKLVNAAGEAGVKWILPNESAPDTANEALVKDLFVFQPKVQATRKAIADLGKSAFIAVSTCFWYEWSLAIPPAFSFDFAQRTVTLFDEVLGQETDPCKVGRAVAALLSLPIKPECSNKDACLEKLKNKAVYTNSFTVSQKDMLESALRVTGGKEEDWTITKEPSHERYSNGLKEIKEGQRIGFAKMMYTRVFYPDGCGDFENSKGTINSLLGLPNEDIDESTERAIERSKATSWVH